MKILEHQDVYLRCHEYSATIAIRPIRQFFQYSVFGRIGSSIRLITEYLIMVKKANHSKIYIISI